MKLLDTYIIKEIIYPFFFGIAAFTSIIAGSSVLFNLISKAVKYGFSSYDTFRLFAYQLPSIISVTLPMAILLATILVISRLSSNLEILALRAAGVNILRILVPILCIGLITSLVNIVFNEIVVPKANYHAEIFKDSLKKTNLAIKENVNITQYDENGAPLRIINVREVIEERLQDITIAEYDAGRLSRVIRSKNGSWDPLGGWIFYNGIMHVFLEDSSDELVVIEFEREIINLNLNPFDFIKRKKSVEEMSATDLLVFIQKEKLLGKNITELMVHYYVKFALPFACLIFTIIGSAVSFQHHRESSSLGMGLSIIIILCYYILYSLSVSLGIQNILSPVIAAWTPNIVIGLVGVYLLNRLITQ